MSTLILLVMLLYIVSPVDACPGPFDDILVLLVCMALRNKLSDS